MKETLSQQQQLRQMQRLTPMQVQFVRMLEMTGPEIETEVKQAVEDMPALEVSEADSAELSAGGIDDAEGFNESAEQVQLADYRGDDIPSYMLDMGNKRNASTDGYYRPEVQNDELSLLESLRAQISELHLSPEISAIATYIAGNIDNNGYLKRDAQSISDDLAFNQGIDVDPDRVEEALEVVRSLDPPGVGAYDLRDCLLLQLRRKPSSPRVDLATRIIEKHFDLFSKRHFDRLAERLGVDHDTLTDALSLISRLNPKPGNQHGDTAIESSARQIVPEFSVETDGDNLTVNLLNNIPELTISETFNDEKAYDDLAPRQRSEALTFMRSRRDEAANFIKTLQMRQSTLFNVMKAITGIQRDFFLTGDETKLRPMVLKDVAAITGYDPSVISRATATKYVATPSGTYPLKFFFHERPKPENEDITFHRIAAALRDIIAAESKESPLSDEQITSMLNSRGFNVARRTVAKYRERLGYPVARLRRSITRPNQPSPSSTKS